MNNDKFLDMFCVGFDSMIKTAKKAADAVASNYPPFNIKKIDEDKYLIEMSVAGFGKQDLEIELSDKKLTVKGNLESSTDSEKSSYIWHGLATRAFTRQWSLADNVEVKSSKLTNGILKIWLETFIPKTNTTKINIEEDSNDE